MDYTTNILVIVNLILCLYFIYIYCNLLIEKFDSTTDMSHNHYNGNTGCGSLCGQPTILSGNVDDNTVTTATTATTCKQINGGCSNNDDCCIPLTCINQPYTIFGPTSYDYKRCK